MFRSGRNEVKDCFLLALLFCWEDQIRSIKYFKLTVAFDFHLIIETGVDWVVSGWPEATFFKPTFCFFLTRQVQVAETFRVLFFKNLLFVSPSLSINIILCWMSRFLQMEKICESFNSQFICFTKLTVFEDGQYYNH